MVRREPLPEGIMTQIILDATQRYAKDGNIPMALLSVVRGLPLSMQVGEVKNGVKQPVTVIYVPSEEQRDNGQHVLNGLNAKEAGKAITSRQIAHLRNKPNLTDEEFSLVKKHDPNVSDLMSKLKQRMRLADLNNGGTVGQMGPGTQLKRQARKH